jgi:hypothetical protein
MGFDLHFAHAPQHVVDTDTRGVSDPAGRFRGDVCNAEAGSLTPFLAATPVLGVYRAAQTAALLARPD